MKTLLLITMLAAASTASAEGETLQSLYMMVLQAKSCLYDQSHHNPSSRDCKLLEATAPDRVQYLKSIKALDNYDRELLEEFTILYKATQESV